jgi:ribulose-phosphate 3-epimerase
MCEIIPGILEKDWREIEKKLEFIKSFAKTAHIDIIDGKFAPNATFLDPAPFSKYSKDLFLELHLMVKDPIQYLESFAKAGFKRFIGHIECLRQPEDQAEFIAKAKLLGEVGLAIDGPTPTDSIKVPFYDLDFILVMTIKAGESGQTFNKEYLKKVQALRQFEATSRGTQGQSLSVEIDGGVDDKTILLGKNAGANRFVSNSFIFNSHPSVDSGPHSQFNLLKTIAEK